MNKFMQWFQNIMRQSNGIDDLSTFLLKTGSIIGMLGFLFSNRIIIWIGFILIILMYIRTFMKDKQKFYQHNRKYHEIRNKIINYFNGQRNLAERKHKRFNQRKTHRFYKCPKCGQKIRVPKGKGKIAITCPSCSERFVKKT